MGNADDVLHLHTTWRMMFICGQSNRIWHYWCGRYPGSVGILVSPSYMTRVPIDKWMPFALDNGAYTAWRDNKPWDEQAWVKMIAEVRMKCLKPMWVAVPDVVGDRQATLDSWKRYAELVPQGWAKAFCVQDGMTPKDVSKGAAVVFVGGTDGWKFPNLEMWTKNFDRVHCARVNSAEMFESCERLGCQSVDGTGWFRDPSDDSKLPAIERFLEGHRNGTPDMLEHARCIPFAFEK